MHFPGHMRAAFQEWLDADTPEMATVEENYEPTQVPADKLLQRFVHCSDIMPNDYCQMVASIAGDGDLDVRGMTYGIAANAFLVARSTDEEAAVNYLRAVFGMDAA